MTIALPLYQIHLRTFALSTHVAQRGEAMFYAERVVSIKIKKAQFFIIVE